MTTPASDALPALTRLSEDEQLLRASVREFAEAQIRPLVREMDEQGKFSKSLLSQLFDLGIMGIEIPESYRGAGGCFFHAVVVVEELSRVDPSVGVLVDVQNTLVVNALLRWASPEMKQRTLPALATKSVGAYALSEASSGSDAFALQMRARQDGDAYVLHGAEALDHQRQRGGLLHRLRDRQPGRRLPRHHRVPRGARHAGVHGRQEGRQARHPRVEHLRVDLRGVPRAGRQHALARSARATRSPSKR